MDQWQTIGTAPRDGSSILGWWEKSQTLAVIYWDFAQPGWLPEDDTDIESMSAPTHWMPIPKPPGWKDT
jgi:hypothetical protein